MSFLFAGVESYDQDILKRTVPSVLEGCGLSLQHRFSSPILQFCGSLVPWPTHFQATCQPAELVRCHV